MKTLMWQLGNSWAGFEGLGSNRTEAVSSRLLAVRGPDATLKGEYE